MYDQKDSSRTVLTSVVSFQVYVNSFLALLNARYYLQANAGTMDSCEPNIRDRIYRPDLHIMASQDEELQASQKNLSKHPEDEVVHLTRPAQAAMVGSSIIF